MAETDLNAESIKAANYYTKKKYDGAPLTEKTLVVNSVAHGFYMGVRWMEEQLEMEKCDGTSSEKTL